MVHGIARDAVLGHVVRGSELRIVELTDGLERGAARCPRLVQSCGLS
jgi:hypothetical protein